MRNEKGQFVKGHSFWPDQRIKKECTICNKIFYVQTYRNETAKCCSNKCVGRANKDFRSGQSHHHWKNGKTKMKSGYILIHSLNHPQAVKNRMYEHRVVMENHIGRLLERVEIVHHINGVRDDNRIENLMLFKNHSDHRKYHWEQEKSLHRECVIPC